MPLFTPAAPAPAAATPAPQPARGADKPGALHGTRAAQGAAPRCWIAVACAEHALLGRDHQPLGFMQVCHGKRAPLARLRPGDAVVYYAPSQRMGGQERLQQFVSIGIVQPGAPYTADMGGGFVPWRRDVRYLAAQPAPIAPLLDTLGFIDNRLRWGWRFRFGLFEIPAADMRRIAQAMQVPLRQWQALRGPDETPD